MDKRKAGDNLTNDFGINPVARVGDIVRIEGYGMRTFEVFSYSYEYYIDEENEYDDLWYDLSCTKTYEYFTAGQEDITVVLRKGERPIGKLNPPKSAPDAKEKDKPTIDDLLEELGDALAMVEMFGDHEDDEKRDRKYALKVCEIKAKLREVVE